MPNRPRVLVVEDEALLLRSLTRMLGRAGYDVVACQTLAAAIEAVRTEPIDVVLTDLRIGDDTGFELIRIATGVSERPPGVVVLSGFVAVDAVEAAFAAGAHAIIRKPVHPHDLLAALAAARRS